MIELEIGRTHRVLLEILKDIDAFCREEGLRYCLSHGTLLGAVRHHGFIPWDDDADIFMPRPDFMRFVEIYNRSRGDSPYRCVYREGVDGLELYVGFAKVSDLRTVVVGQDGKEHTYGVNVDIFPVDGTPEDPVERERFARRASHFAHRVYLRGCGFFPINFHNPLIPLVSAHLHSREYWISKLENYVLQYDFDKSGVVWDVCERYDLNHPIPKAFFDNLVDMEFEGCLLKGFADADSYLTTQYGDYMTPPPESQRQIHHTGTFWREDTWPF